VGKGKWKICWNVIVRYTRVMPKLKMITQMRYASLLNSYDPHINIAKVVMAKCSKNKRTLLIRKLRWGFRHDTCCIVHIQSITTIIKLYPIRPWKENRGRADGDETTMNYAEGYYALFRLQYYAKIWLLTQIEGC